MARGWHYIKLSISSALLSFSGMCFVFKKNQNASIDLLSIPQSGGKMSKRFRWDHRLQIQNVFVAFKRVPRL